MFTFGKHFKETSLQQQDNKKNGEKIKKTNKKNNNCKWQQKVLSFLYQVVIWRRASARSEPHAP